MSCSITESILFVAGLLTGFSAPLFWKLFKWSLPWRRGVCLDLPPRGIRRIPDVQWLYDELSSTQEEVFNLRRDLDELADKLGYRRRDEISGEIFIKQPKRRAGRKVA